MNNQATDDHHFPDAVNNIALHVSIVNITQDGWGHVNVVTAKASVIPAHLKWEVGGFCVVRQPIGVTDTHTGGTGKRVVTLGQDEQQSEE